MSSRRVNATLNRAYTLVEVLVVIVVLGIAGAIVVPQMLNAGQLGVQAAARMIIADMHYAQNDAVAKQQPRFVEFDPDADTYKLTDADGNTIDLQWRIGAGQQYQVNFAQDNRFRGVEMESADFDGEPVLAFDMLGTPEAGGKVVLKYNDQLYEIRVAPFTGRITVEPVTGD